MTVADRLARDAADWVARLNSDQHTEADRRAFGAWLDQDPEHARAYAEHVALWEGVGSLAMDPSARALLWAESRRRPAPGLWAGGGAAGLLAAAAAVVAVFVWTGGPGATRYATDPGKLRTLALEDGSSVMLDASSVVAVRFDRGERRIVLERGRAFFRVAKDARRPFRVFAGRDEVRAIGTAFEVSKVGEHARVVLEEGRLAVYPSSGPPAVLGAIRTWTAPPVSSRDPAPALVMTPGQEVRLADARPPALKPYAAEAAAWRYGRLVFDDTPLDEAAAELNAYGGPKVVLADPALAGVRVSGVFHTGRAKDVAEALAVAFPVRIAREDDREILLEPR